MSFISYPPSIYNLDYDSVKELSNRLYIQREECRKFFDKLDALKNTIKNFTKDIKNLVSLKYLCEYENTIKETYEEFFDIETLVKTEIVKYYIDNLYVCKTRKKFNFLKNGKNNKISIMVQGSL